VPTRNDILIATFADDTATHYIFSKTCLLALSLFNNMYDSNLLIYVVIHSGTVTCNFPWPAVFNATYFPFEFYGKISSHIKDAVSSALLMGNYTYSFSVLQ
jgi:hypothetical protein